LRGVYTLIIRFSRHCKISVGARITAVVEPGLYLYTGSALGRGSTSLEFRIRRHLRREKREFWHIDRLLACESASVISVILAQTTGKAECGVNDALLEDRKLTVPFMGIGSSDCRCESHFLAAKRSLRSLQQEVRSCYLGLGLSPRVLNSGPASRLAISQYRLERGPNVERIRMR
jgi:Uri superfamily endonuclease